MKVSYDPVAKELIFDPQNGFDPLVIKTTELELKLWGDGGIVTCVVNELTLDVAFFPLSDEPTRLRVDALAPNRWLVGFEALPSPGVENPLP